MAHIEPAFLQNLETLFGQAQQAKQGGDPVTAVGHYETALELSLAELAKAGNPPGEWVEPGGTYPSCWWIEDHVELSFKDVMHFCCYQYRDEDGHYQGGIKIADLAGRTTFPVDTLLAERRRIRQGIRAGTESVCLKCPQLARKAWAPSRYPIRMLTINTWTACNLRCEYCFTLWLKEQRKISFDLYGLVLDILWRELLDPQGMVVWGGGDVSALPEFEAISHLFSQYGVAQQIKTSGIKYSRATETVLRSGRGLVEISLDSGSRETFQAVKGRDMFDTVVANIRKYAQVGPLALKYIILEKNHGRRDLETFRDLCVETGVRYVTVTPEWDALFNGRASDTTLRRAAWLIHALRRAGVRTNPGNDDEVAHLFHGRAGDVRARLDDLATGRLTEAQVFAEADEVTPAPAPATVLHFQPAPGPADEV